MTKRKTNKEFQKEVFDLVGNKYEFLEPYINTMTKLRVKHNKCGNIYKVSPNSFLRGNRCPYCKGGVKKTDTQFKQEVKNLVGGEYTFLDSYVNSKAKLRVKHNKCGNTYEVVPNSFLRGHRCPYCNGNAKKTDIQFKQEVKSLVGNEYVFLDAYRGNRFKLRVKHNKCGYIYKVAPYSFLGGRRCPYCFGTPKKTNDQFKQDIFSLVGDEYMFLDPYQGTHTKLRVKHNNCGKVYLIQPDDFLRGHRCPYCAGLAKKTDAQFKQEIFDLVGNEYNFLDHYINTMTKIRVKHNKCGHVYEVAPHSFISNGYRCPYCNIPKGESLITRILKSLGIKYEYQKTFEDLKDTTYLSYDFYLPDQNILIEYQGRQHYQPVDYFGGESRFAIQQKHDKMKSDYAKAHNYNLITVPYTEDTFSKIKKYLLTHGLSK